jgi:putative endonuclease
LWPFRHFGKGGTPPDPGRAGETLAARFLKRRGMKILARNYRCPAGEADLIVLDRKTRKADQAETICFVEVKTRRTDQYTTPASAVDADKQRRLVHVARYYLVHHPAEGYNVRFDVLCVVYDPAGRRRARIDYIPQAF